jgi:hypothetical protein
LAHRLQGLSAAAWLAAGLAWSAAGLAGAPAWSAAGPAAGPFSHKLHLKLLPDCGSCHAAAASSAAPSDNLLPKPEACRACHQTAPAIKAPAATLITRFSHVRHVRFGGIAPVIAAAIDAGTYHTLPAAAVRKQLGEARNACAGCHRGLEESDAVTKASYPQMADCLVCHPVIDAPFSCELCHQPGPHLKPASHTPGYLETHSSPTVKLDKPSCVICHGRRFTCLGCH